MELSKSAKPWYPALSLFNYPYNYFYNYYMNCLMWNHNYQDQLVQNMNSSKMCVTTSPSSISTSTNQKHIGTYFVQIEQDRNFNVVERIIGDRGKKIRAIIYSFPDYNVHKLKIRLTGKGSGYRDSYRKCENETNEDLKIHVSSLSSSVFDGACCQLENMLKEIYSDFEAFLKTRKESLIICPKEFRMSYKSINFYKN